MASNAEKNQVHSEISIFAFGGGVDPAHPIYSASCDSEPSSHVAEACTGQWILRASPDLVLCPSCYADSSEPFPCSNSASAQRTGGWHPFQKVVSVSFMPLWRYA